MPTTMVTPLLLAMAAFQSTTVNEDVALDRLRGLVAAYFCTGDFDLARDRVSNVLTSERAVADDFVNAALIEAALGSRTSSSRIGQHLKRARELGSPALRIAYAEAEVNRAQLWAMEHGGCLDPSESQESRARNLAQRRAEWIASLRRVLDLEPSNPWARWSLALELTQDVDETWEYRGADLRSAAEEARRLFLGLLNEDPERLGPLALPLFQRAGPRLDGGPRSRPDLLRYIEWLKSDLDVTPVPFVEDGPLGVDPPPPRVTAPAGVAVAPDATWTTAPQLRFATEGAVRSLDVADVEWDYDDDVLVADARGLLLLRQQRDGTFLPERLADVDVARAQFADLERLAAGEDMSIVAGGAKGLAVLDPGEEGHWVEAAAETSHGACSDFVVFDYDGDGDEDVVALLGGRLFAWRNDGFATKESHEPDADGRTSCWKSGPLRMADASAKFPQVEAPLGWLAIEDLDRDRDVDLLVGGAGSATLLLRCRKLGRFTVVAPAASGLRKDAAHRPLLADFDRDGRVDVLWIDAPVAWQRGRGDGTFDAPVALPWLAPFLGERSALADVDRDGEFDLVTPAPGAKGGELVARLGSLLAEKSATLAVGGFAPAGAPPLLADLDQDADFDVVAAGADGTGVELRAAKADPIRHALYLRLWSAGRSPPTFGAIVEARVDGRLTRQFVRGTSVVVASGTSEWPDLIEIDWTHARDSAMPRQFLFADPERDPMGSHRRFRLDDPSEIWTVMVRRPDRTLQVVAGFDYVSDPNAKPDVGTRDLKINGIPLRLHVPLPGDRGPLTPRTLGGDWKLASPEPGAFRFVRQEVFPGSGPPGPHGPYRHPPK